jgi:hypothetical protein
MPDPSLESCFGRGLGVVFGYLEVQFPETLGIGCALRPRKKNSELCQVIGRARGGRKEVMWRKRRIVKGGLVGSESAQGGRVLRRRNQLRTLELLASRKWMGLTMAVARLLRFGTVEQNCSFLEGI